MTISHELCAIIFHSSIKLSTNRRYLFDLCLCNATNVYASFLLCLCIDLLYRNLQTKVIFSDAYWLENGIMVHLAQCLICFIDNRLHVRLRLNTGVGLDEKNSKWICILINQVYLMVANRYEEVVFLLSHSCKEHQKAGAMANEYGTNLSCFNWTDMKFCDRLNKLTRTGFKLATLPA